MARNRRRRANNNRNNGENRNRNRNKNNNTNTTQPQSQAKGRAAEWMSAGKSRNEKRQAQADKRLSNRDVRAMAEKKGISMDRAYKQASKLGIAGENVRGYAAYKTGLRDPGVKDIKDYKANMVGDVHQRGENKGQVKNIYRLQDVKYLKDQGYSRDQIAEHISNNYEAEGAKLAGGVQNFLDRWKKRVGGGSNGDGATPAPTPTPEVTPDPIETPNPIQPPTTTPTPEVSTPSPVIPSPTNPSTGGNNANANANANANQNVTSGNIDGDITVGDIDNTGGYIGQIGHTNNSVNINYNNASANATANAGSGGGGGSGNGMENWSGPANDPLANLMGGMAYQALNTNAWHRSQSELNGIDRAAQAVALNNTLSNSREISAGYAQRAANGTDRMYRLAQNQWADTMGDTWRYQPPSWTMPKPPEDIESNTDELFEEGMDAING